MNMCAIEECNHKQYALGFCSKHYWRFRKYGDPLYISDYFTPKFCKIKDCNKKYYAKGYCQKHWAQWHDTGNPLVVRHKCAVVGCFNNAINKYCGQHRAKIKRGFPPDMKKYSNKGKRNGRWNGGVSEYPNHYEFKQNRLLILQRAKGLCEICGKSGSHVHHKDGSKINHNLTNLILLCNKCHGLIHKGRNNKTSKFIRLYGMTLEELTNKLRTNTATIYRWHKENRLKEFLTNNQICG